LFVSAEWCAVRRLGDNGVAIALAAASRQP
jgi:hypothetical protein